MSLNCSFLTVSLSFPLSSAEEEVENFDVSSLQEEALRNIEADSFWCMSKLLDGIQVNVCLCVHKVHSLLVFSHTASPKSISLCITILF